MQTELTHPGMLLDEQGRLAQVGWPAFYENLIGFAEEHRARW